MKTLNKFFLLPLFLLGMIVSGCTWLGWGKYDDGPAVSMIPVEARVRNTWKWSYAIENGENKTGDLANSTLEIATNDVLKICEGDSCKEGTWNLVTKNAKLQFIFGADDDIAYDIKYLKNKEMWLQHNDSSGNVIYWELVDVE